MQDRAERVERVQLTGDAFQAMLRHALITDQEEILGLLFGSFSQHVVNIWAIQSLPRNCKEKDRVEVDELELSKAMTRAEELSRSVNQECALKGWYHSHPKITVLPSHIDLRTQLNLQRLGQAFVGLIVSCFSRDPSLVDSINLIAFQTDEKTQEMVTIPVTIVPQHYLLSEPARLLKNDSQDHVVETHINLMREEKQAFDAARSQSSSVLATIYNSSLFNLAMSKLIEESLLPLYEDATTSEALDQFVIESIRRENEELEAKLTGNVSARFTNLLI